MVYRGYPSRRRRLAYKDQINDLSGSINSSDISLNIEKIPLPNELEQPRSASPGLRKPKGLSFIFSWLSHISIDEIILIGLIFLLIDEGIEDDFLLLILFYLLLGGRE